MALTRRYDAVFLDAQGTLLQPYPSVAALYASVCRDCGREVSQRRIGVALRDLWRDSNPSPEGGNGAYGTSDQATREWWYRFNSALFRRLGMQEGLERFLAGLWDLFGRPESWRLFPEVKEVVAELRTRRYRLGIVSNWDSRLLPICESLGITPFLDFVLASAVAGMEKPDPRIFEMALARAGVPPERAIHVGDDPETDLLGARAAGIDAVLIDRAGRTRAGETTVHSLIQLLDLLP